MTADTPSARATSGGKWVRQKACCADLARLAHRLTNHQLARRDAARQLVQLVRDMNDDASHQWTDDELDQLLGDAIHAR